MIYLIILLAILMVVAPLMAFKPSERVKRQMAFRDQAMALGLQIKVADLPQSHRDRVRQQDIEQGVVYRLPFRVKKSLAGIEQQICVITEQGFEWPSGQQEFVKQLFEHSWARLPAGVVALEVNATALGLYWREQGLPEQVPQLYEVLSEMSGKLINYYGSSNAGT